MGDDADPASGRSVELPSHVVEIVEDRVADTEFESVDAYVAFALQVLVREIDRQESTGSNETDDEAESIDGSVHDRLESLGYL